METTKPQPQVQRACPFTTCLQQCPDDEHCKAVIAIHDRDVALHDRDVALHEQDVAQHAIDIAQLALWKQLADMMPQIVWSATEDGLRDYVNDQWQEVTGLLPSANYGNGWLNRIHPEDRVRVTAIWQQCVITGQSYEGEYRILCKDSIYRWFLGRAKLTEYAEGMVRRWVGTCTDIDNRKRSEENLKGASARKDEFLAMLAHELRNPLSVIGNAVQLLEGTEGEAGEIFGMIARQTKHLTRLVEDLLDVSRITRGKIVLRKEVLDLRSLLTQSMEATAQAFNERNHTVTVNLGAEEVRVHADATRIMQVFSNLLHNAAKYTPEGGEIAVTLEKEDSYAVVKIKDNGLGLDTKHLDTIFDLFYQADAGLARAQGGLGIGLTLVRNIMLMHNGTVEAYSEGIGKGSTFTVRLPSSYAALEKTIAASAPTVVKRRVLVVDDMPDAAHSLSMLVKSLGHEIYTASSGRTALQFVQNMKPEYVLMDIGMPEMDGFELARRIRMLDDKVILIAITGYGMEEDRRRTEESGFNYHLVKPVEKKDLAQLIN